MNKLKVGIYSAFLSLIFIIPVLFGVMPFEASGAFLGFGVSFSCISFICLTTFDGPSLSVKQGKEAKHN